MVWVCILERTSETEETSADDAGTQSGFPLRRRRRPGRYSPCLQKRPVLIRAVEGVKENCQDLVTDRTTKVKKPSKRSYYLRREMEKLARRFYL